MADYHISLCEEETEGTLDLICDKANQETVLLTFEKDYDYQNPEDITAEAFEKCLGHSGFRLYRRHPLGPADYYYEVNYYAVEESLELLAYRWGSRDNDFYEIDLDEDGVDELICNLTWMADGGTDAYIYHFDGESVLQASASSLLDEPVDFYGTGSIMTTYLPETNQLEWNGV